QGGAPLPRLPREDVPDRGPPLHGDARPRGGRRRVPREDRRPGARGPVGSEPPVAPAAPPIPERLSAQRTRTDRIYRAAADLREQVARRIVGLDEVVEQVVIAILCEGHALLEGVPGLAKTLLVSTVAELLDLSFSRIQFTPDLMPGDITGGEVLVQ